MAVKKWLQVVGVMQVVGEEAATAVLGAVAFAAAAAVVTAAFGVFVFVVAVNLILRVEAVEQ